jgi:hypothetical protein
MRGFCNRHYQRWWKYGDPNAMFRTPAGEGFVTSCGYRKITANGRQLFEHVHVAEKALGKPLPSGAVVHHVNEVKTDNRPENLVICPNRAYHNLLHSRMAAQAACGDPNKRACRFCKEYDAMPNLRAHKFKTFESYCHAECKRNYDRAQKAKKRVEHAYI